ncbi:DEKNAAC101501 [Brettanomyces naardenensis]|uniref:DEKNAAC101501 n=1 Tax=Brettanomyces naardenensis TaxID=13370 RepID=A0A448YI59_BRENA|nr:DEKNAAC101501 [Brettanomyces naardenensis]
MSAIVDEEEGGNDNESVSTFRSLPSTLEGTDDEIETIGHWLDEERERRSQTGGGYGSIDASPEDEEEDLLRQADRIFQRRNSYSSSVSKHGGMVNGENGSLLEESEESSEEDFQNEKATVSSESRKLGRYSAPLVINFLLEQVFSLVCVVFAGHLGKEQLAAVSMASMVSAIVLAIYEGIATSLDTLCPQAYGAGQYYLVGLHTQRCAAFSLTLFVPAAIFWWYSGSWLRYIIDDEKVVSLTQQFLRILILGAPPYILFEDGKRFLQAQGIFDAGTVILFITAPFDVFLNWLLVYSESFGMGYVGAPIAAVINFWLTFILLVLFVVFIDGDDCWGGLNMAAFTHWYDLSLLAIPGVIMLLAESMAYEILTLLASYFGTNALAAQSALSSVVSLLYMIPFALSVASSTRIANFVGSGNIISAKVAVHVGMSSCLYSAVFNSVIIYLFSSPIAKIFTDDPVVQKKIVSLCPLMSLFVVFDGWACIASGIMRALGLQGIGGTINMVGYYFIAVPLALLLGFTCNLQLEGLWLGNGAGLLLIAIGETWVIYAANWTGIVEKARERNKEPEIED